MVREEFPAAEMPPTAFQLLISAEPVTPSWVTE